MDNLTLLRQLGLGSGGMNGVAATEHMRQGQEMARNGELMRAMWSSKFKECHPSFEPPEGDEEMGTVNNISGNLIADPDDLAKILAAANPSATPPPIPQPPPPPQPQRRSSNWSTVIPWLIAMLASLLLIGVSTWIFATRPSQPQQPSSPVLQLEFLQAPPMDRDSARAANR